MSRTSSRHKSRNKARNKHLRPLAGLVAAGLTLPALAAGQSKEYPTYVAGPLGKNSWVVSDGAIITPAGTQVNLGIRVRAKAVAVNPNTKTHTAAVLTLGTSLTDGNGAVEIFDTLTGVVQQNYIPSGTGGPDPTGSYSGIAYSADGKHLVFSQNSSFVTVANVNSAGLLSDDAQISVPPDNSFITCFPNSPPASYGNPCGSFYAGYTSYPGGVALSKDGKSAYALLNQNNTLVPIDLTANPPTTGTQIRVGNAPHSIVINATGTTAYVSNEGGREATAADFQVNSAGTEIVADPFVGAAITGTVSVVDLESMTVTDTISTGGFHPTGLAFYAGNLLVANTYSDTISVINTATNTVSRTINVALPIGISGQGSSWGAGPVSIAVNTATGVAYVALYHANAVAVVDLSPAATSPVLGYIPVAYAPASVVIDKANNTLLVANDKGIGTRLSYEEDHGVWGFNTHQDNGTVSIVPIPLSGALAGLTQQVIYNNHWDLAQNIASASGGSPKTKPVALPAKIGDPSLIKHVFLIVRENRTYDQILGDVAAGNGDPSLAVFGDGEAAGGVAVTPNAHLWVQRFPLLDNFYDPSRQSADGHQWITEGVAPYADDIQAPEWVRSYPGGNMGDALAYLNKGFFFSEAEKAGLSVKIYGEAVESEYCAMPLTQENVCSNTSYVGNNEPSWSEFYADTQCFEGGPDCGPPGTPGETSLYYQTFFTVKSTVPSVANYIVPHFPMFDLGVPDQFRYDLWIQDFNNDVKNGTVPTLEILWIMCDHTTGPPSPQAEQADNDLAIGRLVDSVSHSNVWATSAIFLEEDDAQNGVDHIDGHRSPGYIISPYAVQYGPTDHTYYTQTNMTRTIEQILGLPPMNSYDLIASPMRTDFVKGTPPAANFEPWTHVPNQVPLDQGVSGSLDKPTDSAAVKALRRGWLAKKAEISAGKLGKPDSEDPDTVNHYNWYESTGYTRPYPGEKTVRPASEFNNPAPAGDGDDD